MTALTAEPPAPVRPLVKPVELAVVDYGMGNRRSVEKALQHVGANAILTSDQARLRAAAGLVLPGVGAFPRAMQRLRELGLDALLREQVRAGKPLLGICLGMQLAFERSSEHGDAEGLALIAGEVRKLEHGALKLPHIGWNEVQLRAGNPLLEGFGERCAFYHVHSYAPFPDDEHDVLGTAVYGSRFASVVAHANVYGVQFHPEKSSAAGLRLLVNFARVCAQTGAPVGP